MQHNNSNYPETGYPITDFSPQCCQSMRQLQPTTSQRYVGRSNLNLSQIRKNEMVIDMMIRENSKKKSSEQKVRRNGRPKCAINENYKCMYKPTCGYRPLTNGKLYCVQNNLNRGTRNIRSNRILTENAPQSKIPIYIKRARAENNVVKQGCATESIMPEKPLSRIPISLRRLRAGNFEETDNFYDCQSNSSSSNMASKIDRDNFVMPSCTQAVTDKESSPEEEQQTLKYTLESTILDLYEGNLKIKPAAKKEELEACNFLLDLIKDRINTINNNDEDAVTDIPPTKSCICVRKQLGVGECTSNYGITSLPYNEAEVEVEETDEEEEDEVEEKEEEEEEKKEEEKEEKKEEEKEEKKEEEKEEAQKQTPEEPNVECKDDETPKEIEKENVNVQPEAKEVDNDNKGIGCMCQKPELQAPNKTEPVIEESTKTAEIKDDEKTPKAKTPVEHISGSSKWRLDDKQRSRGSTFGLLGAKSLHKVEVAEEEKKPKEKEQPKKLEEKKEEVKKEEPVKQEKKTKEIPPTAKPSQIEKKPRPKVKGIVLPGSHIIEEQEEEKIEEEKEKEIPEKIEEKKEKKIPEKKVEEKIEEKQESKIEEKKEEKCSCQNFIITKKVEKKPSKESNSVEQKKPEPEKIQRLSSQGLGFVSLRQRKSGIPDEPKINQPNEPKINQPDEPKTSQPSEPKINQPSEPKISQPSELKINQPSESKISQPCEPKISQPNESKIKQPVKPKINQPCKKTEKPANERPPITVSNNTIQKDQDQCGCATKNSFKSYDSLASCCSKRLGKVQINEPTGKCCREIVEIEPVEEIICAYSEIYPNKKPTELKNQRVVYTRNLSEEKFNGRLRRDLSAQQEQSNIQNNGRKQHQNERKATSELSVEGDDTRQAFFKCLAEQIRTKRMKANDQELIGPSASTQRNNKQKQICGCDNDECNEQNDRHQSTYTYIQPESLRKGPMTTSNQSTCLYHSTCTLMPKTSNNVQKVTAASNPSECSGKEPTGCCNETTCFWIPQEADNQNRLFGGTKSTKIIIRDKQNASNVQFSKQNKCCSSCTCPKCGTPQTCVQQSNSLDSCSPSKSEQNVCSDGTCPWLQKDQNKNNQQTVCYDNTCPWRKDQNNNIQQTVCYDNTCPWRKDQNNNNQQTVCYDNTCPWRKGQKKCSNAEPIEKANERKRCSFSENIDICPSNNEDQKLLSNLNANVSQGATRIVVYDKYMQKNPDLEEQEEENEECEDCCKCACDCESLESYDSLPKCQSDATMLDENGTSLTAICSKRSIPKIAESKKQAKETANTSNAQNKQNCYAYCSPIYTSNPSAAKAQQKSNKNTFPTSSSSSCDKKIKNDNKLIKGIPPAHVPYFSEIYETPAERKWQNNPSSVQEEYFSCVSCSSGSSSGSSASSSHDCVEVATAPNDIHITIDKGYPARAMTQHEQQICNLYAKDRPFITIKPSYCADGGARSQKWNERTQLRHEQEKCCRCLKCLSASYYKGSVQSPQSPVATTYPYYQSPFTSVNDRSRSFSNTMSQTEKNLSPKIPVRDASCICRMDNTPQKIRKDLDTIVGAGQCLNPWFSGEKRRRLQKKMI